MGRIPYGRYLLGLLVVVLTCNYQERALTNLALESIKTDLRLSDVQLGLVSGFGFALFYSVLGIQIARWADASDRVRLLGVTTALWGVMVALCGAAGSFSTLLLLRAGVGIGEAGCIPIANSLISDHFERGERPRALSVFMIGGWLSMITGYFLGGSLIERLGWRLAFVALGLPGIPLAYLALRTLHEPRKFRVSGLEDRLAPTRGGGPPPTFRPMLAVLWSSRTFRHLLLAFCGLLLFAQGIWQWQAVYLLRAFHVPVGELGRALALAAGVPGVIGGILGGELAARWAPANERLQLRGMALAVAAFALISACVYLSSSLLEALVLLGVATLGGATVNGPLFATVQAVVPTHLRASAIAIIYLFANLIGMGLGPFIAGALSDAMRSWAGTDSLRIALLLLCPGYLLVSWLLWRGSRSVMKDIQLAAR